MSRIFLIVVFAWLLGAKKSFAQNLIDVGFKPGTSRTLYTTNIAALADGTIYGVSEVVGFKQMTKYLPGGEIDAAFGDKVRTLTALSVLSNSEDTLIVVAFDQGGHRQILKMSSSGDYAVLSMMEGLTPIKVQLDGKILCKLQKVGEQQLIRLTSSGTQDESFVPALFDGEIKGAAVQTTGKVVAVGDFQHVNQYSRRCIARLNNDGTLDEVFDPQLPFTSANPSFSAVVSGIGNKIYAAGTFGITVDQAEFSSVIRLTANGTLDNEFRPFKGLGYFPDVADIAMDRANRLLTSTGVRIKDGEIDPTFNPLTGGTQVVVESSGSILYGQSYGPHQIARVKENGSRDDSFLSRTLVVNYAKIKVLETGEILVGDCSARQNGEERSGLVAFNEDGSFGRLLDTISRPRDFVPDGEGGLLVVGSQITRLRADGKIDPDFHPPLIQDDGTTTSINCVGVLPSGRIVVAGSFQTDEEPVRKNLLILEKDGTRVNAPDLPDAFQIKALLISPAGEIFLGGARIHQFKPLIKLLPDGSVDNGFQSPILWTWTGLIAIDFHLDIVGYINAMAFHPNGKILFGGNFQKVNESFTPGFGMCDTNGIQDTSFNNYGDGNTSFEVLGFAVREDGALFGGVFDLLHTPHVFVIGSSVSVYPSDVYGFGVVSSVALSPEGSFYLGGRFSRINEYEAPGIVRLWGENKNWSVHMDLVKSGGEYQFQFSGQGGSILDVESSSDFFSWIPLFSITNYNRTASFAFPDNLAQVTQPRFFRTKVRGRELHLN